MVIASKPGYLFRLLESLFYNRDADGVERLVIPETMIQDILQDAYDNKHHFGKDHIMQELQTVYFRNKRMLVNKYIAKCHTCGANR